MDVTLRTHGADGLPEGHPEIREYVQPLEDYYQQRLDARVTDYGQALRMASLKVRGNVPSLAEIRELMGAPSRVLKYRELIKRMLDGKVKVAGGALQDDPRFKKQVLSFWRNTLRMGPPGNPAFGIADQDAAPTMAAMVTVSDTLPLGAMFTQPSDRCFSMDAAGTFTSVACTCSSGVDGSGDPTGSTACYDANSVNAGIIGNPAFQAVNHSGLAFHRVRVVQEIFACRPHPAEPQGVWDQVFQPIGGTAMPTMPVNFASAESVVCAKCHQTMNRQAAFFANYDRRGVLRDRAALKTGNIRTGGRAKTCGSTPATCDFEVDTPTTPPRSSVIADFLTPQFQSPLRGGWRVNAPAGDLSEFTQGMANDPEVARCMVNRLWYWMMSRSDIVNDPVRPPLAMTDQWIAVLNAGTHPFDGSSRVPGTLKAVLYTMLTSDDYTRF